MWTASSEFGTYRLCEQRRFRRACASAQSRQNLRCSLIQAVSREEPSDRKPDPWLLWMAGHAQLKFVMTECSKTQIRLTGPICCRYSLESPHQGNFKEYPQHTFYGEIIIGYSTVFCKIWDFICTSLRSAETVCRLSNSVSAERRRMQIKSSILPNTVECPFCFTSVFPFTKPFELPPDKNNEMNHAYIEDSDHPGHLRPVWSVFAVRIKEAWILSYQLST